MLGDVITCNLNMQKYDYSCKLRHKTFHFYACYHALSAFLSFHTILSDNLKMHYFRDNYAFLRIDFRLYYSHINLRLSLGFNVK